MSQGSGKQTIFKKGRSWQANFAPPSPSSSRCFRQLDNSHLIANRTRRVVPWSFWKGIKIESWDKGGERWQSNQPMRRGGDCSKPHKLAKAEQKQAAWWGLIVALTACGIPAGKEHGVRSGLTGLPVGCRACPVPAGRANLLVGCPWRR
jgi:hypothetical protein